MFDLYYDIKLVSCHWFTDLSFSFILLMNLVHIWYYRESKFVCNIDGVFKNIVYYDVDTVFFFHRFKGYFFLCARWKLGCLAYTSYRLWCFYSTWSLLRVRFSHQLLSFVRQLFRFKLIGWCPFKVVQIN